jgi:hypothetical protein
MSLINGLKISRAESRPDRFVKRALVTWMTAAR